MLVNCLFWALIPSPQGIAQVATGWAVAIPCALGSRILLNLRERQFKEVTLQNFSHWQAENEAHQNPP